MRYFSSSAIFLALAISVLTAATVTSQNAPGDLDSTFSLDGKLTDGVGRANEIAIQQDGKLVVAGESDENFAVARYNPDGTADATFGVDGKVITEVATIISYASSVTVQSDGKIVAVGFSYDGAFFYFTVLRYNPNGSLDAAFGQGGIVQTRVLSDDYAEDVAVQSDGKIIVGGCTSTLYDFECNNWALVRYNPDGSLDTSFDFDGKVITQFGFIPWVPAYLRSIAIQPDGKIVAAGRSLNGSTHDFTVIRYNVDGSLDQTFDHDGKVLTPIGTGDDRAYSVVLQPDGKLVVAGDGWVGTENHFSVVRYDPNGSLDTTFDSDGKVTTPIGAYEAGASSVMIQSDGKILLAGTGGIDFALVRYRADGSLDRTFGGGDGISTVDFENSTDNASGMVIDSQGRAVLAGTSDGSFALARFLLTPKRAVADFDGDGRSDVSIFRPIEGVWHVDGSTIGYFATHFGLPSDTLAPADYDGDRKTDIAVYRNGTWWRINSSDGTVTSTQFGLSDDVPVPTDYTGDGRDELAVYRAGQWWSFDLSNGQPSTTHFGLETDKPVPADYDGDGRVDQAVYRNGEWHLNRSTRGYTVANFGLPTDIPVVADYDGDGKADLAVYRAGTWYLQQSIQGFSTFQFGLPKDIPVPADYDGDGRTDAAVYREGTWYVLKSTGDVSIQQFGLHNDEPIAAAFLRDKEEQ